MTCLKAQEFLGKKKIQPAEVVDAKKTKYAGKEALKLAAQANELYASKGTKVVHFDLRRDRPDDETLLQHMLGPTGNLRAPTLMVGKTLLIGFDETTYNKVLGLSAGAATR
jgi:arsenate reductase-like glutaredoxin family protein